jgi:hypothetical protein
MSSPQPHHPANAERRSGPAGRADRRRPLPVFLVASLLLASGVPSVRLGAQTLPARPPLITEEAERAIEDGLAFLARSQARDGSWRTSAHYGTYPTAMTALAGLALMAGGNTPVEGRYAANVRRALDYVLNAATPSGLIARPGEEQRPMYAHGFAMLFLAEAYGMEQDITRQARIKRVLDRAIELTGRSQSSWGGWLYSPDSNGDEGSVTVTQIQGLRAARNAGIHVPRSIIDKAVEYIEKSRNPDGGIRYTARGGGPTRPPITAAAVAVLYNAGEYEHPVAEDCLRYLKDMMRGGNSMRVFGGHQYYATLYLAQAMYLSSEENWRQYFPGTRDDLIRTQNADGSWMGDSVGTSYGTSIALIVLQLPYKHLPILQR